ncbi:MAG: dethiobiotin synthase [Bacteroidota bacterium]
MNYFVTAIDTDSGKTLVSAILCEALRADYWKPVQAGHPRDADTVRSLISNDQITIYPEAYLLNTPASPHASALRDGIKIDINNFIVPKTSRDLIIEGAGGCLVPLNDTHFVVDLIKHFNAHTIVVADLYLGSINHTLLTLEALTTRNIPVKGIIFNGEPNSESERIILLHTKLPCLLRVTPEQEVDQHTVQKYAKQLQANWYA